MGLNGGSKLDGQYGYRQPAPAKKTLTPTPTGGVGSIGFGGSHQWDPRKVAAFLPDAKAQLSDAIAGGLNAADANTYLHGVVSQMYADAHPEALGKPAPTSPSGNGANPMMDALLRQYNQNPYAALSMQLLQNTQNAQNNGKAALDSLLNELNARKNPYSDLKFQDATATANPLAAYMQASGAGTGQVDAYSKLLQQLEQNAVNADSNRASALGASFNADTASRISNAQTEQAGFLQQLQQQLLAQQNNVAQMQQKYKNDLYMQMAQLAAKYGMPMPKVG